MFDPGREDTREEAHHLFGERVGRDVPVADLLAEQQIAYASADDPATLARLLEARADADRVAIDQRNKAAEVDVFDAHRPGVSRLMPGEAASACDVSLRRPSEARSARSTRSAGAYLAQGFTISPPPEEGWERACLGGRGARTGRTSGAGHLDQLDLDLGLRAVDHQRL